MGPLSYLARPTRVGLGSPLRSQSYPSKAFWVRLGSPLEAFVFPLCLAQAMCDPDSGELRGQAGAHKKQARGHSVDNGQIITENPLKKEKVHRHSAASSSQATSGIQGSSGLPLSPRLCALAARHTGLVDFLRDQGIIDTVTFAYGLDSSSVPQELGASWQEANTLCDSAAKVMARVTLSRPPRAKVIHAKSAGPLLAPVQALEGWPPGFLHEALQLDQTVADTIVAEKELISHSLDSNAGSLATELAHIFQSHWMHSSRMAELQGLDAAAQGAYINMLCRHLSTFSYTTLRGALSAWKRWNTWHGLHAPLRPPIPAPAMALQLFLEDVRAGSSVQRKNAGGHHAAARVHAGLAFITAHLGLHFDLDFVKFAAPVEEVRGKVLPANDPLLLRDLAHAKAVAENSVNEVMVFVALSVLVLFSGGARFAHAQRSRLLEPVPEGLVLHCKRGKSRQGGLASPPFDWACPSSSLLPQELLAKYMDLHRRVVPSRGFLVPNLDPPRSTLSTATGFRNSPMGDNAWRAVLRTFIQGAPAEWPQRPPGAPGGRSTRRALATVAEVLGLAHHERLPLGSWVEDIADQNKKFNKMPARYISGGHQALEPVRLQGCHWQRTR